MTQDLVEDEALLYAQIATLSALIDEAPGDTWETQGFLHLRAQFQARLDRHLARSSTPMGDA
jgi:hypothetical protein